MQRNITASQSRYVDSGKLMIPEVGQRVVIMLRRTITRASDSKFLAPSLTNGDEE